MSLSSYFLVELTSIDEESEHFLRKANDIILYFLVDLTSSDRESEHFLRKLNRARFALARTDSVRSVSGSFMSKPPYRRAVSVPLHLVAKTQGSTTIPKGKDRFMTTYNFISKTISQ